MKRFLIALLTILLVFCTCGCSSNDVSKQDTLDTTEGKYPTKWDDTEFYKSEADFDAELANFSKWADELRSYQGKLNTADGLFGYIMCEYDLDYNAMYDRLNSYCHYGNSVFPLEQKYIDCGNKLSLVSDKINEAKSFVAEEMATIPYEKRIELFSDERIYPYAYIYSNYLYEDVDTDSSQSDLINILTSSFYKMDGIYDSLVTFEIPSVQYKLSTGETVDINTGTRSKYTKSSTLSLKDKQGIEEVYWKNLCQYKNTVSSIMETYFLENNSIAIASGYDDAKQAALGNYMFEEDIIDKIVNFGRKNSDAFKDYLQLYANKDGKYNYVSNTTYLSSYNPGKTKYDDAVEDVIAALSVLGDEYIEAVKAEFNSGHIDVYPAANKATGDFETGNLIGQYPYMMFNYNGETSEIADIAHEMGHACYDIFTNEYQDITNWITATLTQEVASITDELLYYNYKINNASSDEEKAYYLETMLNRWISDSFQVCIITEFEEFCYEEVTNGRGLDAEKMADKWEELCKYYYGDNLIVGDDVRYRFMTSSSLFNNFYTYQYATSIVYATELCQRIFNNEPGAKEALLNMLKTGASVSSVDALSIAGIDIYDDQIYENSFNYFKNCVEMLKNLKK